MKTNTLDKPRKNIGSSLPLDEILSIMQASSFLEKHGLRLRITLSNTKPANLEPSGDRYRVTLSRHKAGRMTFDFWGSQNDACTGKAPSTHAVLSCIASDCDTPETFEDFCAEDGYDAGSRKALQTFNRADLFAKRLRAFFTESELEALPSCTSPTVAVRGNGPAQRR